MEGELNMGRKKKFYYITTFVTAGILLFFLGMVVTPERGKAEEATPVRTIVIEDQSGFTSAISEVANILMPTVVYINVTGTVKQRGLGTGPFGNDPFFRYFLIINLFR